MSIHFLFAKDEEQISMDILRAFIKTANESIESQLSGVENKDHVKKIVANDLSNYFDGVYRDMNRKIDEGSIIWNVYIVKKKWVDIMNWYYTVDKFIR